MSTTDINIINVNGLDYPIKDQEARDIAEDAMGIFAYIENGYTASQAYAVIGTPICWKGELYYTTTAIAQGALFVVGTNLSAGEKAGPKIAIIEDELTANGNRIYMDYKDGKYGYNTSSLRGADTFHPFSGGPSSDSYVLVNNGANSYTIQSDGSYLVACDGMATRGGIPADTSVPCNITLKVNNVTISPLHSVTRSSYGAYATNQGMRVTDRANVYILQCNTGDVLSCTVDNGDRYMYVYKFEP